MGSKTEIGLPGPAANKRADASRRRAEQLSSISNTKQFSIAENSDLSLSSVGSQRTPSQANEHLSPNIYTGLAPKASPIFGGALDGKNCLSLEPSLGAAMFDGAAGPRLEDFVSLNPEDLATFSSERELAEEDELVFQIFDDLNRPLETLRDSVAAKAEALAGEHAWHDLEAFRKLKCVVATDETPAHVRGSVGLGLSDNLDDEWLAVAVLFEMTRADGAVAVSCVDGDGEFLLVDAADALPDWLEPDTAGKRAWLRRGAVAVVLDGPPRALPCDRALALLRGGGAAKNEAAQLATSALVHRCGLDARGGLSFAPAAALAMRARVVLPRKALECFLAEPRLVTVACDALCAHAGAAARDASLDSRGDARAKRLALDRQAAAAMTNFGQHKQSAERVEATVRFARCSYAALRHARFAPPRCFRAWVEGIELNSKRGVQLSLGIKLAVGLEIALARVAAVPRPPPENGDALMKRHAAVSAALAAGLARGVSAAASDAAAPAGDDDDDAWLRVDGASLDDEIRSRGGDASFASDGALDPVVSGFDQFMKAKDRKRADGADRRRENDQRSDSDADSDDADDSDADSDDADDSDADSDDESQGDEDDQGEEEDEEIDSDDGSSGEPARRAPQTSGPVRLDFAALVAILRGDAADDDDDVAAMDAELAASTMAETFERAPEAESEAEFAESETAAARGAAPLAPLDVDFNLVKSLLDSVEAQHGDPGAAAILLDQLRIELPPPAPRPT